MLKLKCENCGADYEKPEKYKVWQKETPHTVFKWNLTFCDECRHQKETQALKRLPEILKSLCL